MAQALFLLLKQHSPNRTIDVLAPDWCHPILARMPEVHKAIPLPLKHGQLALGTRFRLGRTLKNCYHQAIVLPNSFKSALIPFHADIPIRTGFVGEFRYGLLNDIRRLDKLKLPRTVDRFVNLGLENNQPLPEVLLTPYLTSSPDQAKDTLKKLAHWGVDKPLMALCPGAEFGPAKRWPAEYFSQLASIMVDRGWKTMVFGSPKERELGEQVANLAGRNCINLVGRTTLEEAVDLLSLADCVVTNDSGLMHVAAALDRPVLALFGSSDPNHTPALTTRTKMITLGLPCAPCFRRTCPEKHLKCLTGISVEMVLSQLDQHLQP